MAGQPIDKFLSYKDPHCDDTRIVFNTHVVMSDEETAEADARALRILPNGCRCHGQGECAWCVQRNADDLLEPLGET